MLAPTLFGLLLAQAPATMATTPGTSGPPATVYERELGRAFRLKSEHFLTWRGVRRPMFGWTASQVEVWRVEISPTAPRLSKLALTVETTKVDGAPGTIHPRLEYLVDEDLRVGLDVPLIAVGAAMRALLPASRLAGARPGFLVRGRF